MIEVNKVALNRNDDKQIAKKDGISTFAYGLKSLGWNDVRGWVYLDWKDLFFNLKHYLIILNNSTFL